MRRAATAWLVAGWVLALALACAGPIRAPDRARDPGAREEPRPYAPLGRDFFTRQSVVATFDGETRRFEILLESRCGELRLAALTPFGLRLFSAVRNADGLTLDVLGGQPLPFDPVRVLRDVERSLFLSEPVGGSLERVVVFAGEPVRESWRDGRLVARRVRTREDDAAGPGEGPGEGPEAELVIRYDGPLGPTGIAERIDLANEVVGYRLAIHNHATEALVCDPD